MSARSGLVWKCLSMFTRCFFLTCNNCVLCCVWMCCVIVWVRMCCVIVSHIIVSLCVLVQVYVRFSGRRKGFLICFPQMPSVSSVLPPIWCANHKRMWLLMFVQDYGWLPCRSSSDPDIFPWLQIRQCSCLPVIVELLFWLSFTQLSTDLDSSLRSKQWGWVGSLLFRRRPISNCAGDNPTPSSGVLRYSDSER